jgi:hypothetical protein
MPFDVINRHGYVDLYINGKFYCSADNFGEALREYNNYVKERLGINDNCNSK